MAAKMLDWDLPLSQQPHILPQGVTVDDFVASIKGRKPTEMEKFQVNLLGRVQRGELDPNYATGRNIYEGRNLQQYPSPRVFSERLNSLGIPGIRYLDQGSRNVPTIKLSELQDALKQAQAAQQNPPKLMTDKFLGSNQELIAKLQQQIADYPKQTYNYVAFPGTEGALKILERK
jgi:chromosomal replication initiation ATPase DnaA